MIETTEQSKEQIKQELNQRLTTLVADLNDTAKNPVWCKFQAQKDRGEDVACPLFDILPKGEDTIGQYNTLVKVADERGWKVTAVPEDSPTCSGHTDWSEHIINIDPNHPSLIRANTLAHELAHSALHQVKNVPEEGDWGGLLDALMDRMMNNGPQEVEAEAIAWLVSNQLGLPDCTGFTAPYLLEYGEGLKGALGDLKESHDKILNAATAIVADAQSVKGQ